MKLEDVLFEKFGFSTFRSGQKEIITDVIQKKNVVAMLPTGAGKSLCYLLPGYVMEGVVIIVSPLLSLMEDQVRQLQILGEKRVVAINSFLSYEEKISIINSLQKYKYIFVSPEMLQSTSMINRLKKLRISLFVIDEAHCISQWGHEFRTDYLKLHAVVETLGQPTVLALTATATKKVIHDIVTSLTLGEVNYHLYSIDRPNISIHVDQLETIEDKKMKLLEWVGKLQGPGIIYFSSRYWTEHICELLKSSGIEGVAYYHGGMETDQRLLIQQQFLNDQLQLICCTNAFGMGVNKPNVRYVIHFHYPSHMEGYLQEIGRAGRDGEKSIAVLLHSRSDQELPQALIMQEYPTRDELEHLFRLLNETLNKNFYISEEWLLSHTTLTETKWRFIKYQLEQKGLLKENKLIGLLDSGEVVVGIETFIEERLAYKQGKLNEMRNWIMTSSCRRQAYLAVFNETLEAPLEQCCDNCSIDYNMYNKHLEFKKLPPIKGWQQELQAILLSRRDYEKSGGAY